MGRIAGLLVAFAGVMTGLVVSDNLLAIFLFWEATSILSYLLIGLDDRSSAARAAALRALLTTGAGGLAMFAGFVALAVRADTWSMAELLASPPTGTVVEVALVLVLLGAFTKSAQVPFHFWLPGAMAAPTPVSAYLHSATMVKAGVYLIARFSPTFHDLGWWQPVVVGVGLATMVFGGWRALGQRDLKLLLAQGTVSQLGFMVALFGTGSEAAVLAGATLLLAHGLFKAAMFMVVGIVDHSAGTRDIARLTGLARPLRTTFVIAVVAAASMAGLPPLFGFIAKEAAYEAGLDAATGGWGTVVVAAMVAGSVLTFAYSTYAVAGAFGTKRRAEPGVERIEGIEHPPSIGLVAPAALLAVLTVVLGLAPVVVDGLVVGAAQALRPEVAKHLALWHGVNAALGLSALTVGLGLVLWWGRALVARVHRRLRFLPRAAVVFDRTVSLTLRVADEVTGRLQSGSLPVYLMIILATVLAVPSAVLAVRGEAPSDLAGWDHPLQLVVVAVMVVATVGAVITSHRLAAVLAVGAVGYGVAVLFVLQGAPDLALTQLLIETLVIVVFVLVLRHLPRRFSGGTTALPVAPRAVLALLVGVAAAAASLVAFTARPPTQPSSVAQVALSEPEAHSANVVNAILVDFRAFDTMGEVSVVTVAALGVIGLVRAARRERVRTGTELPAVPLPSSPILDAAVRALFRTVLVFSMALVAVGHNAPGGGFIGGLVAGAAFMLVFIAGGHTALRTAQRLPAEVFLGVGVATCVLVGMAGWLVGGSFLEVGLWSFEVPGLGELELSSALVFDVGVYSVVVGLVLALLHALGREEVQAL
jgi:multicomponent Na+:H+ antiporter subunit A